MAGLRKEDTTTTRAVDEAALRVARKNYGGGIPSSDVGSLAVLHVVASRVIKGEILSDTLVNAVNEAKSDIERAG